MPERLSEIGRRMAEMLAAETDQTDDPTPLPWRFFAALHQARERARDEWRAAQAGVAEAERADRGEKGAAQLAREERRLAAAAVAEAEGLLREAHKHSRSILVEAFVSGQATDTVVTEADALAQLRLRTEQLAHAGEIVEALCDAIAELEI